MGICPQYISKTLNQLDGSSGRGRGGGEYI